MKHSVHMLAGCILPLLLLFVLPLFGVSGGATLFIAIVALFVGHLWMSRHDGHGTGGRGGDCGMGHGGHGEHSGTPSTQSEEEPREHYQH